MSYLEIAGKRFHYAEAGSGVPVLYLHGFPTSGHLWRNVTPVVAGEYRTICPDLPGFGDSDLLDGPHGWRELTSWIDDFVTALDIAPLHLYVHDWGGLVGLPWLCDHPDKARSVTISDTSFNARDRWHAMATAWRTPEVGEQMLGEAQFEPFIGMLSTAVAQPLDDEAARHYWKGMATPERRAAKLEMYRSLDFEMFEPYMQPFLAAAAGRARVIWGEKDPFLPAKTATELAERLGAELTIVEGAGHFIQEDAGEIVGKLHLEFLSSQG
ncbi:MAG TPA: alpha/beta fold hydrolase [Actinomycetota bacterium]|nr:alpha/beta fold hydrolase [Actinomycetota bacterium]